MTSPKLTKSLLKVDQIEAEAFCFLPEIPVNKIAVFTHGYTSNKNSIFSWGQALLDINVPTIIFDMPGHFMGSFREVPSFEIFKDTVPRLFEQGLKLLEANIKSSAEMAIIGGHSLGALFALKSSNKIMDYKSSLIVSVGLGSPPKSGKHLFEESIFAKTMNLRSQLVSDCLHPDIVFPWIAKEKESLSLSNQNLYFLSGKDDLVVGEKNFHEYVERMQKTNNVFSEMPNRLPHHMPELAGVHIKNFLKKNFLTAQK